jgi:2-oxoglutarate ferredoxin oxidoreductase subunit beta
MLKDLLDPEFFEALAEISPEPLETSTPPLHGTRDPSRGLFPEQLPPPPEVLRHRLMPYLRREVLPTTFCSGCGGGTVLNVFTHAVDELGMDPRDMVCVTGIGCSSWIPSPYFLCDTLHTTHGRAIAFATGVKVMKPRLKVIVIAGDGDLAGIGGNHLIHAARRNVDLSVFLVNNLIYGMTGGQVSPTTPQGIRTTTTPYRNVEHPFRIAELVSAAGGVYVARWTTFHVFELLDAMKHALATPGFTFVEIMSQCPVSYGKSAGLRDTVSNLKHLQEASIPLEEAAQLSEDQLADRIPVGRLVERKRSELTESLAELNAEREEALRRKLEAGDIS